MYINMVLAQATLSQDIVNSKSAALNIHVSHET